MTTSNTFIDDMMTFMGQVKQFPKDTVFVIPLANQQSIIYSASQKEIVLLFNVVMPQRMSIKANGASYEIHLKSMPEVEDASMDEIQKEILRIYFASLPTLLKKDTKMDLFSFLHSKYANMDMTTLFMRGLYQGGLDLHFLKTTNEHIISQWQDAWAQGLLAHPNAIINGWNTSLAVLAIALHRIGQGNNPEQRYDFGMQHDKANAFMQTLEIEQHTNMREWLEQRDQYFTPEHYLQLQNLLLQLELGVKDVLHLRDAHRWWDENKIESLTQPLEIEDRHDTTIDPL